MKPAILGAALVALAPAVHAAGDHAHSHDEAMAIGRPGDPAQVDRTIEIQMLEPEGGGMAFAPSELVVHEGETIRFVVANDGALAHEVVFDTVEGNREHGELMERFPEMEHDDPNAVRLDPGETGEIVWTFANAGTFQFACLIPGHMDAGMYGPVIVK
ncbi:MAG: putative copper-binding protein [Rhodobacteraceae bacterium HLUCCO07]|nr:MAG: putative copper-binding protein [Rhodobacteraceae bacterium HLUCCO07]